MTRPEIKFSETTGDEVKTALEQYRDDNNHNSFEAAIRDLLPEYVFPQTTDTVTLGTPPVFETTITSITDEAIHFEDTPQLNIAGPDTNWTHLTITTPNAPKKHPLSMYVTRYQQNKTHFDASVFDDIVFSRESTVLPTTVEELLYTDIPDLSNVAEIRIPRTRLQAQTSTITDAIDVSIPEDTINNIRSYETQREQVNTQLQRAHDTEDEQTIQTLSNQHDTIETLLTNEIPSTILQARRAYKELHELAYVLDAFNHMRAENHVTYNSPQ